jgi:uncharacterized protein YciI
MTSVIRFAAVLVVLCISLGNGASPAETPPAGSAPDALPLFAVQVRVGHKWDPAKAPHEQALFREHSANLKRLRDAGHLIMGARYSDVGLVILAADSEASARAMMDADPSIAAGTFKYEIHPFNVFYPGTVRSPPRSN